MVTAFTVSELLRENQQFGGEVRGGRCKITAFPTQVTGFFFVISNSIFGINVRVA